MLGAILDSPLVQHGAPYRDTTIHTHIYTCCQFRVDSNHSKKVWEDAKLYLFYNVSTHFVFVSISEGYDGYVNIGLISNVSLLTLLNPVKKSLIFISFYL